MTLPFLSWRVTNMLLGRSMYTVYGAPYKCIALSLSIVICLRGWSVQAWVLACVLWTGLHKCFDNVIQVCSMLNDITYCCVWVSPVWCESGVYSEMHQLYVKYSYISKHKSCQARTISLHVMEGERFSSCLQDVNESLSFKCYNPPTPPKKIFYFLNPAFSCLFSTSSVQYVRLFDHDKRSVNLSRERGKFIVSHFEKETASLSHACTQRNLCISQVAGNEQSPFTEMNSWALYIEM